MPSMPDVKFCYQCGRRIDPAKSHCWYCGADKERELRPRKRCPFCGEYIVWEAIKCRHCGEFVDGRARPAQQPAGPQQIVYVIDKDLLRAARDQMLTPGRPVPQSIAARLDPQTVRAIETNEPRLLMQAGVRALPAPGGGGVADDGVLDVEASEIPQGPEDRMRLPAPAKALTRHAEGNTANLPARTAGSAGASLPARAGAALGGLITALARRALSPAKPAAQADIDVTPEDRFRVCERCGTEILRSDNYCFHCGMQYHLTKADVKRHVKIKNSPAGALAGAALCAALLMLRGPLHIPAVACLAVGGAGAAWSAAAIIRHRGAAAKLAAALMLFFALTLLVRLGQGWL